MKLTKEDVYISLRGKTKEELTDLWELLDKAGEKQFRETINEFLDNYKEWISYEFHRNIWILSSDRISLRNKQEVTIEQLKEIIKPMETKFTPIAMRCTQEQFDAIIPKLKGLEIEDIKPFTDCKYLVNNLGGEAKVISNFRGYAKICFDREVHEEWNEEIFLKACGIETDSLEKQLQKAEAEVKRLKKEIEEENRPKVGDWVKDTNNVILKYQ